MGLLDSWLFVVVSPHVAYTNIVGLVIINGALILAILSLVFRFPSLRIFFSFSGKRNICLCRPSPVIARPSLPFLNFFCLSFLPILSYEISSFHLNLNVVLLPLALLSGISLRFCSIFVSLSLSLCPPNLFA